MKTLLTFVIAFMCSSAGAQVHRCTDADGHVSFSDAPCSGKFKGELIQNAPTRESLERDRIQAEQARQRFQAQQWEEVRIAQDRAAVEKSIRDARLAEQAERRRQRPTVCSTSGYSAYGTYSGTTVCR